MQRLHKFVFSSFILFAVSANAQEKEIALDPVTITSTLNPINASKTGRNIVVVKGEELANLPVHSLDDLLRFVPGVEVQARGPMGAQSDFVLRGGTFQQVLVVLDGLRLNDPNTGHFSSYIPIAPEEIDRIEILKGASSAIYGSDAVGGVIHIITKAFTRKASKKELNIQQTSGEYGLQTVNAGGYYNNGKTAVSAGIISNNANGQQQRGTNGFFNLNTFSYSLNHQLNQNWQIGYHAAFDDRKFAAQNFYTTLLLDTADEKVQTFWNQLRVAYQNQKNKFSFNSGFKYVEDIFRLNPSFPANNNRSKLFQALGVYDHSFSEKTSISTGAQFQKRSILSNDRGNHQVNQAAGFVMINQTVGTSLFINPALRVDWDELSGTELVPQINLSYKTGKFQFRASGGKTIRNADFTEQYNNYNKPPFVKSGNRIGNPYLKAEHSWSYEAGLDWFGVKNLKISSTWFQKNYDNLIDWTLTPYEQMPRKDNLASNSSFYLATNITEVTTKGFETDVQLLKPFSNNRRLYSTVGLVWLNSKSNGATPSLYVSSHANFLTNFNLTYSLPWWSIGINGLYKNRQAQATTQNASTIQAKVSKDYFVMNGKMEFFLIKNKLSAFGEADNIFNRKYSDLLGTPMPGRWLMGGLKVTL